jgi:pimeloyl-ACP methyl ester carboxylesterase
LAVDYHVIGITRRGFGASSFSPASGITDYADDVLAVLDTLKIARAFILGHSIAGAELTSIGVRHPERIAGLIYIEAAYPYAFREPHGPTMQEFSNANAGMLQPPTPLDTNLASFRALQRWDARTFGFQMPESEFRQTWDSTPDGRPVKPRDAPGFAGMMTMLADTVVAAAVPVPALVMFAIPKVHDPWMDARDRKAATEYYATIDELAARQADAIQKNQPNSRVSRLRGMHYLFLSNAADVLRAIRAFSATFN